MFLSWFLLLIYDLFQNFVDGLIFYQKFDDEDIDIFNYEEDFILLQSYFDKEE